MKKTTIQFISLSDLVKFQAAIGMNSYRINTSAITLTGAFSESSIQLAKNKYHGLILKSEPTLEKINY